MSEEATEASSGSEGSGTNIDSTSVPLAFAAASRDEADAFLRDQRAFIALQKHHLHEQFKHLGPSLWEKRLGVVLRAATAFTGLAAAAAIAFLIWNAVESNDLVIDAFDVPQEIAARGLSGTVVAAKLSDRIAAMQAETQTQRPAKSYANGLSEGLKLEIPETGVSLSEIDRFLRQKLGHDLHIGGEVVRADNGVALTARAGTKGSATVTGPADGMDSLMQQLAEGIYRITQPYRYAVYLRTHGRRDESLAIVKDLALKGPVSERSWAYLAWANFAREQRGESAAQALVRRGLEIDPNHFLFYSNLADSEEHLGHAESRLAFLQQALAQLSAHGRDYRPQESVADQAAGRSSQISLLQGDMKAVLLNRRGMIDDIDNQAGQAALFLGLHELSAARSVLEGFSMDGPGVPTRAIPSPLNTGLAIAIEAGDWPAVMKIDKSFAAFVARYPGYAQAKRAMIDPLVGLALARMGQLDAAEARVTPVSEDCYPCLRAAAQIAALHGDSARADSLFVRAVALDPSLPFAETEWGRVLLVRNQPDAAIDKFKLSGSKSPHFPDQLEGWGEALMAKNQSHLALAKFAEAEKYAPNWGRLHLKWGEALLYAGRRDQAKAQFMRAAQLDLSPFEKVELARRP